MINSSLKEKYWDSATDKQMVISVVGTNQKIDNSMLEIGTFALEESLCSESELKFGACEANCVKFTARNTAGSIIGKTISIEETIDGNSENTMPYGVFKVSSDVPTADRTKRQITAYDAMYDIINTDVKAWYAGLSFPMTLRQFRNSFFAHLGIAQVETNLVNDSMTVNKTIVATQTDDSSAVTEESAISGKTVVTAICEINGCFGNINREGKFEYVFLKAITSALYPAEDLFPRDDLFPSDANTESMTGHYITFDYEDFKSKAITQLEIKTSEDNTGAIVGTDGNNYSITGNFLVSDKTGTELEQIANNLFPIMKQAVYTPIKSCTCVGNPCLTLGEPIRFNTTREIVETYLLQRTLTGVQSKRDSISAQGTQTHSAKVNSIRDTIESVERRTGKLERNADHLQSTYEDLEKQTNSKFEQTADAIQTEVSNRQNADNEMSTRITQTAEQIQSEVTRATGAESSLSSMVTQTAEQIALKVSKGDVSSQLSLESGQITISGNRLIIDCSNFFVDSSGNSGIKGSLLYDYGEYSNYEILSHDGQNRPVVQAFTGTFDYLTVGEITGYLSADYATSAGYAENATNADSAKTASYVANTATSSHTANMYSDSNNKMYYCPKGSSRRFKTDIEPVKDKELDPHRLYDVDIVQFKYKPSFYGLPDDTPMDTVIGFIAEDINKKYPCATEYDEETGAVNNWLECYIIPPMLSLIQEQHVEIEQLKSDNFSLKGEVDILKQRLGKMEEMLNVINSKIN